MNNVLLWIAGLLVAALGALFAVPHLVDWNRYRGVFEEEASRMIGRDVRVGGQVNLRLLPFPFVQFERIYIADGEGAAGEPFVRADNLTIGLAVAPMLRGAVQANEIALKQPVLKLRLAADGGGNWQNISVGRGSLPFVPSDILLERIRVVDGVVLVQGRDGRELVRIDGIDGEASAQAVEGPYRFRANFNWAGVVREIKGTTAKPELDGSTRVKAAVRNPASGAAYALDGRLVDLAGATRLEGDLTAKLPVGGAGVASNAAAQSAFDLVARLAVSARGLTLSDATVSMLQGERQQSVSGRGEAKWDGGQSVTFDARSTWLDLDQIVPKGTSPAEAVVGLVGAIAERLPASGRVEGSFTADQLSLAGDGIGQARLRLMRDGDGGLAIRELSGALPGGVRLSTAGMILRETIAAAASGETGARINAIARSRYEGDLSLRGANLGRFLSWIGQTTGGAPATSRAPAGRLESAFGLNGQLRLLPGIIELTSARGELGATVVTGGARADLGERRGVSITLDGSKIDLAALLPDSIGSDGIWSLALAQQQGKPSSVAKPADGQAGTLAKLVERHQFASADVSLKVRAGQLGDGRRTLRDVTADLAVRQGRLQIADLRFTSEAGLQIEAQGDLRAEATRPKGRLTGVATLPSEAAARDLLQLLGLGDTLAQSSAAIAALGSMRTAYDVRFGARADASIDVVADGVIGASRTELSAGFDSALVDWRASGIDLALTIDRARLDRTLAVAVGIAQQNAVALKPAGDAAQSADGRVVLRVAGPRANALTTLMSVDAGGEGSVRFSGTADLGTPDLVRVGGHAEIAVADAGQLLERLGLRPLPGAQGARMAGRLGIEGSKSSWILEPSALVIGDTTLGGRLSVEAKADVSDISGTLVASRLSPAALLAPVLDGRAGAAVKRGDKMFPEVPFDFSPLAGWQGRVRVETPTFVYGDATVKNAVVDLEFAANRLEVLRLDGSLLEGALSAAMKLTRQPAGAELTGTARVTSARLDALALRDGKTLTGAGTANIGLAISGRGLSPRSLVTSLAGKGEVQLSGGHLRGVAPVAVTELAEQMLDPKKTYEPAQMPIILSQRLAASLTPFRPTRIPVEIVQGAARVAAFAIETPEGRISNRTTIDLAEAAGEAEWRLEAKAGSGKPPLPPVTILYSGRTAALFESAPRIASDQLEREIAVRRMERDVEELERLRKLDEEKAKVEQERRSEAERATTQAAVPPGASAPSAQPPSTAAPGSTPGGWQPTAITPATGSAPPEQPDSGTVRTKAGETAGQVGGQEPTAGTDIAGSSTRQTSTPEPRRRPPATQVSPPPSGYVKKSPQAVFDQLNSNSR